MIAFLLAICAGWVVLPQPLFWSLVAVGFGLNCVYAGIKLAMNN